MNLSAVWKRKASTHLWCPKSFAIDFFPWHHPKENFCFKSPHMLSLQQSKSLCHFPLLDSSADMISAISIQFSSSLGLSLLITSHQIYHFRCAAKCWIFYCFRIFLLGTCSFQFKDCNRKKCVLVDTYSASSLSNLLSTMVKDCFW